MNLNLIDFSEICDRSFATMLNRDKTYTRSDYGIVVQSPNADVRKCFSITMDIHLKDKKSIYDHNFVVRSCKPSENWRLKHIGKRFVNMIEPRRIVSVIGKIGINMEIGPGWECYFEEYFRSLNFKKLEVPEVDFDDIFSTLSVTEIITSDRYTQPVCLSDSNRLIDHTAPEVPKFIRNRIIEKMSEVKLL